MPAYTARMARRDNALKLNHDVFNTGLFSFQSTSASVSGQMTFSGGRGGEVMLNICAGESVGGESGWVWTYPSGWNVLLSNQAGAAWRWVPPSQHLVSFQVTASGVSYQYKSGWNLRVRGVNYNQPLVEQAMYWSSNINASHNHTFSTPLDYMDGETIIVVMTGSKVGCNFPCSAVYPTVSVTGTGVTAYSGASVSYAEDLGQTITVTRSGGNGGGTVVSAFWRIRLIG